MNEKKVIPILRGRTEFAGVDNVMIIRVYCPYCDRLHTHGWPDHHTNPRHKEHRTAHCPPGSPFKETGYYIALHRKRGIAADEYAEYDFELPVKDVKSMAGVYAILRNGEWLYVGKSGNIFRRIAGEHEILDYEARPTDQIKVWRCRDRKEATRFENQLIREKKPQFNRIFQSKTRWAPRTKDKLTGVVPA